MELKRLAEQGGDALFQTLFEHSAEALFVLDSSGRIVDLNGRASEALGCCPEELIGSTPAGFDACWQQAFPGGFTCREALSFRTKHRRKDGSLFPVDVRVLPVAPDRHPGALMLARGLTDLWLLESLDRMTRAMHAGRGLDEMENHALEALIEIFDCDRAWLAHPCDAGAATWRCVAQRARPPWPAAFETATEIVCEPDMAALFAAARASTEPVLLPPPVVPDRFGVYSQMAIALRPEGVEPYLLGLHQCSRPRSWTQDEQRLMRKIGGRLADALTGVLAFRSLTESERRLQAVQRVAGVGWWERDLTGRVSMSNESMRIFGARPADLPRWHERWMSLVHPEDRDRAIATVEAALAAGPRYDIEYRLIRPDGAVRILHSQAEVTRTGGRPLLRFGVVQDVTELRQAEHALRKSERELRARQELLELAQKAARVVPYDWYIGARESENRWSPELEEMHGLEPGSFDGTSQGWKKLVHPDDWPAVKAALDRANETGEVAIEYRVIDRDGGVRWLRANGRMFFDSGGQPQRMVGFMSDVTEWRHAEEALRASEATFRTVFNHATDAFFLLDASLKVTDVNRQACEALGYSREELIGMHPLDFDVGLDEASITRLAEQAGPERPLTFETWHRRKDGTVFPVEIRSGTFLRDGKTCYLALARDMTERKRAEEALRASEARFRTFVDRASDAFILHDVRLTVLDVNRQACEALGYSREELIGMHPRQFDAELDDHQVKLLARLVAAGEPVTFETHHRRRDGTLFPVEVRIGTFCKGEELFYLAIARDISERKQAQEAVRAKDQALQAARAELARVSRVTTIGELTASIAHEVNQPLGAMVANAAAAVRWLSADPPEPEKARRVLQSIASDGRRASEVIQRIRALVQRQPPRMSMVNVNDTIGDVIALAQHELRTSGITLATSLSEDVPTALGDRIQLQQVLLNLVLNAVEAMGTVKDRPRELTVTSLRESTGGVLVEVSDTGPGFAGDDAERLFEAFYTTKPQGLGIGLSISRSIVEAHGGHLWAAKNTPHGAILCFTMPPAKGATA